MICGRMGPQRGSPDLYQKRAGRLPFWRLATCRGPGTAAAGAQ